MTTLAVGLAAALPRCSCEDADGLRRESVELYMTFVETDPCINAGITRRVPDDFATRPAVAGFDTDDKRTFEIRSIGAAPLQVTTIALERPDAAYGLVVTDSAANPATLPVSLSPNPDRNAQFGLRIEVTVDLSAGAVADNALVITTDDPDRTQVRFGLSSTPGKLEVVSGPNVAIDPVAEGQSGEATIELRNSGSGPLTLMDLALESDSGEFCSPDVTSNPDGANCALVQQCRVLQPGESYTVTVTYTPADSGDDSAVLRVSSNDPDSPQVEIPINASRSGPALCACVVDNSGCTRVSSVDFGAVTIGMSVDQTVRLESCGTDPVELTEAALGTMGETFETHPFITLATPFAPGTLNPGQSSEGVLRYAPTAPGLHEGGLKYRGVNERWLPLVGRSAGCNPEVLPSAVSFGTVPSGSTADRMVVVINHGTEDCEVDEITAPDMGFSLVQAPATPLTIAPGTTVDVLVRFTSPTRTSPEVFTSNFEIHSNAPSPADVLNVDLVATAGGTDACELRVSPEPTGDVLEPMTRFSFLNFGSVPLGFSRRLPITLENVGSRDCTISAVEWASAPNTQHNEFDLEYEDGTQVPVGNVSPIVLAPGDTQRFIATFSPTRIVSGVGGAFLGYSPSEEPCMVLGRVSTFCNGVRFVTDERITDTTGFHALGRVDGLFSVGFRARPATAEIVVEPSNLDFEQVPVGCGSRIRRVTVYNQGINDVDIAEPTIAPMIAPPDFEFQVIATSGSGSWPETLPPGAFLTIDVRFHPRRTGPHLGVLEIASFDNTGTNPVFTVPLTGEGAPDRARTDIFSQLRDNPPIDVLWVMDDSGSMGDEAMQVANNAANFFAVSGVGDADYHIAVTTTLGTVDDCNDDPLFCAEEPLSGYYTACNGNDRFITRTSTDPEGQFQCNITSNPRPFRPGSDGAEGALMAARKFLSAPNIDDPMINGGFLRSDAILQLIMVSDERDQSPGPVDLYVNFFRNLKGFRNQNMVRTAVVAMTTTGPCSNGDARYEGFNSMMNGVFVPICTQDWTAAMEDIGRQASSLLESFVLSSTPDPGSLTVCVRMTPSDPCVMATETSSTASEGYTYDPATDSVHFNAGSIPPAGSVVEASYDARCF